MLSTPMRWRASSPAASEMKQNVKWSRATCDGRRSPKSYGTGKFKDDGGIVTAMTLADRIAARAGR